MIWFDFVTNHNISPYLSSPLSRTRRQKHHLGVPFSTFQPPLESSGRDPIQYIPAVDRNPSTTSVIFMHLLTFYLDRRKERLKKVKKQSKSDAFWSLQSCFNGKFCPKQNFRPIQLLAGKTWESQMADSSCSLADAKKLFFLDAPNRERSASHQLNHSGNWVATAHEIDLICTNNFKQSILSSSNNTRIMSRFINQIRIDRIIGCVHAHIHVPNSCQNQSHVFLPKSGDAPRFCMWGEKTTTKKENKPPSTFTRQPFVVKKKNGNQ